MSDTAQISEDGSAEKDAEILWMNAIFLISTPILAAILLPLYIYYNGVHWAEPTALVVLWYLTGMGITAGYHRLYSHRAWSAPKPIQAILLVLGAAALQNSIFAWAEQHRQHHRHTDTEDDPYNIKRGFWWAHMMWVWIEEKDYSDFESIPDLKNNPLCRWQHNNYLLIGLSFNVAVPLLLGLMTGRIWGMLLWAGLVRIVVLHHLTFLINSLAHMWGRRPWDAEETAADNELLAVLTLGEGYHNFHHTFPSDYRNGYRWYHYDPTKWTIWLLSKMGLAEDLRRSPMDRRLKKRWQVLRTKYEEQMDRWNEARRQKIEQAEQRLQEALDEFRSIRGKWKRKADELQAQAKKDLKDTYYEARRQAIDAYRAWYETVPALE